MVLAEAKTPLHKRINIERLVSRTGYVLAFGSFISLILYGLFGLEIGVFGFSLSRIAGFGALFLTLGFVGMVMAWFDEFRDDIGGALLFTWLYVLVIGSVSTLFLFTSGAFQNSAQKGHLDDNVAQIYKSQHHVDDPIFSKVGRYTTNQGNIYAYKVTSPDLKKSEILVVRGHGNTIDSCESVSKEQFDRLRGINKI